MLLNLGNEGGSLRLGYQQMIHARVPWIFLAGFWAGAGLGIAAVVRHFAIHRLVVVLVELPLVALASWYFLSYSYLPEHELAVEVGDPFPSYELADQDGVLRRVEPASSMGPALYIFYRGDW